MWEAWCLWVLKSQKNYRPKERRIVLSQQEGLQRTAMDAQGYFQIKPAIGSASTPSLQRLGCRLSLSTYTHMQNLTFLNYA